MSKNLKGYVDALVDKDGLKTDVKITMTDYTLIKLVGGLILAGGTIALIAHALKNIMPNQQLVENKKVLQQIKTLLETNGVS